MRRFTRSISGRAGLTTASESPGSYRVGYSTATERHSTHQLHPTDQGRKSEHRHSLAAYSLLGELSSTPQIAPHLGLANAALHMTISRSITSVCVAISSDASCRSDVDSSEVS